MSEIQQTTTIDPVRRDPWWREFLTPYFVISETFIGGALYVTHIVLTGEFSAELKGGIIVAWVIAGIPDVRKFWLSGNNTRVESKVTKKE